MSPEKSRTITDARTLSAFANPVRWRIIESLNVDGPNTASVLADRLGVAVGSVSHHMKVLAEAGLVVEAPERARDRRERWWQLASKSFHWSRKDFADDHAALAAADTAEELAASRQADRVREWLVRADPKGTWSGAAFSDTTWFRMTPGELSEFSDELLDLINRWTARLESEPVDPDREPVYFMARAFPSRP